MHRLELPGILHRRQPCFQKIGAKADQTTWGLILSEGREYIFDAPWLTWIPGIAILITVLSFNLLGEGLREAFNPKLRGR